MVKLAMPTGQPLQREIQEQVDKDGSPLFTDSTTALGTDAQRTIDMNQLFPRSSKYGPLDTMTVLNNSSVAIRVFFDGNRVDGRTFPSGTITTVNNRAMQLIRILNLSSTTTISAGEVTLEFSRSAITENEALRRGIR